MKIRIGTRGSALAMAQTHMVKDLLVERGADVEIIEIKTRGDQVADRPFAEVGAPGVFVRELEAALTERRVDLAVHSYKDLPSQGPEALVVAAMPPREDPADVLVIRPEALDPEADSGLPVRAGAKIGTASARRQSMLRAARSDLVIDLLRGNVNTRLRRIREGRFDAILLARAGLNRLLASYDRAAAEAAAEQLQGLEQVRLDPAVFVPAPTQGVVACQVRRDDAAVRALVAQLDAPDQRPTVAAERLLLARIEGGCQVPFGAWCRREDGEYRLSAGAGEDERWSIVEERGGTPEELVDRVFEALRAAGKLS